MLMLMMNLLLWPFTLLGILVVVLGVNFMSEEGVDSSNVFNPMRVTWFSLTRPQKLYRAFPWIMSDEWHNVRSKT